MSARLVVVGWDFDPQNGLRTEIGESIRAHDYCTVDHQIHELTAELKLDGQFNFALHRPAQDDWKLFVGNAKKGVLLILDASADPVAATPTQPGDRK